MSNLSILNLGCGNKIHKECINIDFVSNNPLVIPHNLSKGIPYPSEHFDVVYHSHVLEHFDRNGGIELIKECHRVLKKNGVIRIVVPDLEEIVREYLYLLNKNITKDDLTSEYDYEWIKIELIDQIARNKSGGEFLEYLFREKVPNEEYILNRIGYVAKNIRNAYKNKVKKELSFTRRLINNLNYNSIRNRLLSIILTKYEREALQIGKFRLSGENHYFMYDIFSLSKLLKSFNFKEIKKKTPYESIINNWSYYELDVKNGEVFDPKSLFLEAIK
ncbi:MAG: methyltransferase domain-containing protein [Candidatus Sericytochromatia bacterium]